MKESSPPETPLYKYELLCKKRGDDTNNRGGWLKLWHVALLWLLICFGIFIVAVEHIPVQI